MPAIVCKTDCALPARKKRRKNKALPDVSELQDATLTDRAGSVQKAGALWRDQPALVLILRRPGCSTLLPHDLQMRTCCAIPHPQGLFDLRIFQSMCRTEAKKLWAMKEFFLENGINPVCIVHEWILPEVAAFNPSFWGGEVLLDKEKAFYKALGGGVVSMQFPCKLQMLLASYSSRKQQNVTCLSRHGADARRPLAGQEEISLADTLPLDKSLEKYRARLEGGACEGL